jgi:tetrathionate reductase subunit C
MMESNIIELIGLGPQINWVLPISQDIFFTGVSTGAFLLAALTYGFGEKRLALVARLSLIVALASLLAALLNLVADLHQPGRFYSLFFRMHATSPMTWGVFLLNGFLLLLVLQILFVFRADFARRAQKAVGGARGFYRLLALGKEEATPASKARDQKVCRILALIGLPLALLVHAYSGYILGVVKARPLWHSSLMPPIFLAAALVSGLAIMILFAGLMVRNREGGIPWPLLDRLGLLLAWSITADLVLRLFWYTIGMAYSFGPAREAGAFLFGRSFTSTTILELGFGLVLPLAIMALPHLRRIRPLFFAAALGAGVGVWVFRWQLVIGGQMLPKTGAGFYQYDPPFWGGTGIMHVIGNFAFWIFLLIVLTWVLPWRNEEMADSAAPQIQDDRAFTTQGA